MSSPLNLTTVNDNNSAERGVDIRAVAILFLILTWVSVGLRCYVRIFITKLFRVDDWLSVATLIVFTLYSAFVILGEHYGTGRHESHLTLEEYVTAMKWWYCGEITYVITTCLLKVTIGVFLMQICVKKVQINIIRTVIIGFSIFTTFFLFLMIFQCHPISYFWTQGPTPVKQPEGGPYCISNVIIARSTYAHGALSAAADWTLGILPVFLVWNLNMNPRTKVSVAIILALGAVGSTATVIRMNYVYQIGIGQDFLNQNTDVSIWSTVEPGMGITASSMACLRPLFQAFLSRSRLLGSSNAAGGGGGGNGNNVGGASHSASVWNAQRLGYMRDRNSGNTIDGFRMQANLPKGFRASSAPHGDGDLEAGVGPGGVVHERDGSTHALHEGSQWDMAKRSMTDVSSDEIRRFRSSEGVSVVHAEL